MYDFMSNIPGCINYMHELFWKTCNFLMSSLSLTFAPISLNLPLHHAKSPRASPRSSEIHFHLYPAASDWPTEKDVTAYLNWTRPSFRPDQLQRAAREDLACSALTKTNYHENSSHFRRPQVHLCTKTLSIGGKWSSGLLHTNFSIKPHSIQLVPFCACYADV
ncbi:hypothetical protein AVEN_123781-1 [Araneus ventricosus]|uniref:Uncharacterized protein n=1 Tax=Araneus ventricosus TaxID=182803 RepID=A0A4Y2BMG8_ARAVE|nr:hypothetical protein AVEN_123781-1 [Araneus ventricosus]